MELLVHAQEAAEADDREHDVVGLLVENDVLDLAGDEVVFETGEAVVIDPACQGRGERTVGFVLTTPGLHTVVGADDRPLGRFAARFV